MPRMRPGRIVQLVGLGVMAGGLAAFGWGCGSGGDSLIQFMGNTPYQDLSGSGSSTTGGPTVSSQTTGGRLGGNDRTIVDPCTEPESRKFIRVSMRNQSSDYIHYFVTFVALVKSDTFPEGAVCPDDIALYESAGYTSIEEGSFSEFGSLCIAGPALIRFHLSGQFQGAGSGNSSLASAIAPALGTSATYDGFFSSGGAVLPVPDFIVFHNPGSGEGRALRISRGDVNPCSDNVTRGDPLCSQDAFYYVDETDRLTGSTALGQGSGRRVGSEIQDTGCECLGVSEPWFRLAPSRVSGSNARCNEFLRGGRIDFVFIRDDRDPPIPQLLWRVTDSSGAQAHDFDPRAGVR